jgi:mcbg protein, putative
VFGATIEGNLPGAGLRGFEFENCVFKGVNLERAVLVGASFTECRFEDCNFSGADLTDTSLGECRFTGTKLSGINWALSHVNRFAARPLEFLRCSMDFCWFVGVDLARCRFIDCSIREADFSEARLTNAGMNDCDLRGTRFHGTDLDGASLVGSSGYVFDPRENRTKGLKLSPTESWPLLKALGIEFEH